MRRREMEIRYRKKLSSVFWPGSRSPGSRTQVGGCLTATGIHFSTVWSSDQLGGALLGAGLNRVSIGQSSASLLRKTNIQTDE